MATQDLFRISSRSASSVSSKLSESSRMSDRGEDPQWSESSRSTPKSNFEDEDSAGEWAGNWRRRRRRVRGKSPARPPLLCDNLRQNLLQAIEHQDFVAVRELLTAASPEEAAAAIDDRGETVQDRVHIVSRSSFMWPVTPLSSALLIGNEDIVRTLVEAGNPRSFAEAIQFEKSEQEDEARNNSDDNREERVKIPQDATTLAFRALLYTKGEAESLFDILNTKFLNLENGFQCDAGRTIWFWAARKNFSAILEAYSDAGFPVDQPAAETKLVFPVDEYGWTKSEDQAAMAPPCTTAVWNAAWRGSSLAVQILLKAGATLESKKETFTIQEAVQNASEGEAANQEINDVEEASEVPEMIHRLVLNDHDGYDYIPEPVFRYQPETNVTTCQLDELLAASQGAEFAMLYYQSPSSDLEVRKHEDIRERYASVVRCLLHHGARTDGAITTQPRTIFEKDECNTVVPAIHQFAKIGFWQTVKCLFDAGADLGTFWTNGKTLLHSAAASGSLSMLKLAFSYEKRVNQKDSHGYTPIHECVLHGCYGALELLISNGADIDSRSNLGVSPLLAAMSVGNFDMARFLLRRGADPNAAVNLPPYFRATIDFGDNAMAAGFRATTPLLAAFLEFRTSVAMIEQLLKYRANVILQGSIAVPERDSYFRSLRGKKDTSWTWRFEKYCPVQYVSKYLAENTTYSNFVWDQDNSLPEAFDRILKSSQKACPDRHTLQPILDSCLRELCVTNLPQNWPTTYSDGTGHKHVPYDAIDTLLDYGANPNIQGSYGVCVLHAICSRDGYYEDSHDDAERIRRLLHKSVTHHGADINARDAFGRAPLHYAAVHAVPAVQTLLALGAAPNLCDMHGHTPLLYASMRPNCFRPAALAALAPLAPPDFRFWRDVLFAACRRPTRHVGEHQTRHVLRARTAFLEYVIRRASAQDRRSLAFRLEEREGGAADVLCERDEGGLTALHLALVGDGVGGAVEAICGGRRGGDVFWQSGPRGRTPLVLAVVAQKRRHVRAVLAAVKRAVQSPARRRSYVEIHGDRFFVGKEDLLPAEQPYTVVSNDPRLDALYSELEAEPIEVEPDQAEHPEDTDEVPSSRQRPVSREVRAKCLNMQDVYGWTALHYAASLGDAKMVELLVKEAGLDVGKAKSTGRIPTPLELAERSQNAKCIRLIQDGIRKRDEWDRGAGSLFQSSTRATSWTLSDIMGVAQRAELRAFVFLCFLIWMYLSHWTPSVSD